MLKPVLLYAAVLHCLLALSAEARAQMFGDALLQSQLPGDFDRGRNIGVLDRWRPEYEARGIPVGPFTVKPLLRSSAGYSSNVTGSNEQPRDDAIFTVAPEVFANIDDADVNMSLGAGAEFRRFLRSKERNQDGYFVASALRYSVLQDWKLLGGADLRRTYEQNVSTGVPADAIEPVPITSAHAQLGVQWQVGRVRLTILGDFLRLDYGDVRLQNGGVSDQSYRDRTEWLGGGRVAYEFSPETSVFLEMDAKKVDYVEAEFAGQDNRDATQLRVLGGANLDVGALVRGRFAVGYSSRNYRSPLYDSLNGFVADARLQFFPSQISTVTLSGRRLIGESAILSSPGYFGTTLKLALDHEVRRNLLLNASAEYAGERYSLSDRRDKAAVASGGGRYTLSPGVGFGLQLTYTHRRSAGADSVPDFDEAQIVASLVLQR